MKFTTGCFKIAESRVDHDVRFSLEDTTAPCHFDLATSNLTDISSESSSESEGEERGYKSGHRSHNSLTTVKSDDSSHYVRPIASSAEEENDHLEVSNADPAYVKTVTAWLRSGKPKKSLRLGHYPLNTSDSDIHIYNGSQVPSPPASERSLPLRNRRADLSRGIQSLTGTGSVERHWDEQERFLLQQAPGIVTSSDSETEIIISHERKGRDKKIGNKKGKKVLGGLKQYFTTRSKMNGIPESGRHRLGSIDGGRRTLSEEARRMSVLPPQLDLFSMMHSVSVLNKGPKSPTAIVPKPVNRPKSINTSQVSPEGQPLSKRHRKISPAASCDAEVVTLPLSHIDFLPEQLGMLTYERFE